MSSFGGNLFVLNSPDLEELEMFQSYKKEDFLFYLPEEVEYRFLNAVCGSLEDGFEERPDALATADYGKFTSALAREIGFCRMMRSFDGASIKTKRGRPHLDYVVATAQLRSFVRNLDTNLWVREVFADPEFFKAYSYEKYMKTVEFLLNTMSPDAPEKVPAKKAKRYNKVKAAACPCADASVSTEDDNEEDPVSV